MIQVKDLKFQYPGSDSLTLKGLDFNIEQGEIFGFLGPSGAGKSTVQKILYKILSGYKGEVMVKNKALNKWGKDYFEQIGVGFELPNHYLKLTGKENLDLFASFYKLKSQRNLEQLFEQVDLLDALNKPVEAYSKGMKMRLNFIRAIQHDPDLIYLDEPTSGLDPVNAQKIKQLILELKAKGKTIFITTHSMHTADELCDRVAFIVDGEIRIIDSPQNLKTKYGKEAVNVKLKTGENQEFPLKELGCNTEFLQFIKQGEINRIHTMEATLDEVFINVTGKSLGV
ncbi:MAG: ATP-binding protein [Thalassobius sp.]|nr:ATP-binding protein [Thalassovita sp.]